MTILIHKYKQLIPRSLLGIGVLILIGLSPVLIAILGGYFYTLVTHEPCHEGNCAWAALGWFTLITAPISALLALVLFVIIIRDCVLLGQRE